MGSGCPQEEDPTLFLEHPLKGVGRGDIVQLLAEEQRQVRVLKDDFE